MFNKIISKLLHSPSHLDNYKTTDYYDNLQPLKSAIKRITARKCL